MKKHYLLYFFLFLSAASSAQIRFEKGYFIDSSGQRTECFIKNIDWKNNPTGFEYRLSEEGNISKADMSFVKEFGVYDFSKYIRGTVEIDRSSEEINRLEFERNPVWSKETIFLKVLTEGDASLYRYEEGNLIRFFYKVKNKFVQQLVYKQYLSAPGTIGTNTSFRQQLWVDVNCNQKITLRSLEFVGYTQNDLMKYFKKHNACMGGEALSGYQEKERKTAFHLKITPGINYSSLSIINTAGQSQRDFKPEFNFRVGLDGELILPFNKGKWGLFLEPTYQYFRSDTFTNSGKTIITHPVTAIYNSVELPVGLRHYFFLNEKSKIFLNAAYTFDFSFNSSIDFKNAESWELMTGNNIALGLGFNFDRFSAEFRYYTNRNVLVNYLYLDSEYSTVSFILGYKIF